MARSWLRQVPEELPFSGGLFVTLGAIALLGGAPGGAPDSLGENVVLCDVGLVGMLAAPLGLAAAAGCSASMCENPWKVGKGPGAGLPGRAGRSRHVVPSTIPSPAATAPTRCCCAPPPAAMSRWRPVPAIKREKGVLVVIGDVSLNVPRQPYYDREIDLRISRSLLVPAATIPPTRAAAWTIPMPMCVVDREPQRNHPFLNLADPPPARPQRPQRSRTVSPSTRGPPGPTT